MLVWGITSFCRCFSGPERHKGYLHRSDLLYLTEEAVVTWTHNGSLLITTCSALLPAVAPLEAVVTPIFQPVVLSVLVASFIRGMLPRITVLILFGLAVRRIEEYGMCKRTSECMEPFVAPKVSAYFRPSYCYCECCRPWSGFEVKRRRSEGEMSFCGKVQWCIESAFHVENAEGCFLQEAY